MRLYDAGVAVVLVIGALVLGDFVAKTYSPEYDAARTQVSGQLNQVIGSVDLEYTPDAAFYGGNGE